MKFKTYRKDDSIFMAMDGSIDRLAAGEFEKMIDNHVNDRTSLILDFEKVTYISKAGLRVLMILYKKIREKGKVILCNVSPAVYECFERTGFTNILNINPVR